METIKCTICFEQKTIDNYRLYKRNNIYGRQCKKCLQLKWAQWIKGEKGRACQKRMRIKQKNYMKAWKQLNKDKIAIHNKTWKVKNPEKVEFFRNLRVKRQEQASLNKRNLRAVKTLFYKAKKLGLCADHIIPIAGKEVSGLNVPWNIQYISKAENLRKLNWFCPVIYGIWLKSKTSSLFLKP